MLPAAIVLAKTSAVGSATKEIKKIGEKILSDLLGCRVKPKGTSHTDVWNKAPKFFALYGRGVPESGKFQQLPQDSGGPDIKHAFDPVTGVVFSDNELNAILPVSDRKKIEATLRKKCETVTGSFAYYAEVRPPESFRGFVRLSDGNVYDGATYALDGGTVSSPKSFDRVTPKVLPGQQSVDAQTGKITTAGMSTSINPLLIIGVILAIALAMGSK